MYCAVVPYLEMFCEDQTVVGEETSLVQKQLPQVGRPAETGSTWALLTQARVALGFQRWLPLRSGLGKWISEVVSKQRGRPCGPAASKASVSLSVRWASQSW